MSRKRSRNRRGGNSNSLSLVIIVLLIILLLNMFKNKDTKEVKESNNNGYDAVAIVVGNTMYSPSPSIKEEKDIVNAIGEVFNNTEAGDTPNIVMYSATSKPKTIDIEEKYFLGPAKNDIASKSNLNELITGIEKAASTSPSDAGSDYYAAITMASEYLKNYKNPLIIVYGSGLSDTGVLNFAFDDLLTKANKDDNYITNLLSSNNKVIEGSYNNMNLLWFGIGQTVGEQEELKEWDVVLKSIYEDTFNYLGITSKFNSIKLSSSVKNVDTNYSVAKTVVGDIKEGYTLSLSDRYAKFEPDTANLINYKEVRELLKSYADKVKNNSSLKVKLTGYQTTCAKSKDLSIARATTIKNILVDLGVSEDKIITDGVAGPQDNRVEDPVCGITGIAGEHRTVILEVIK